MATDFCNVDPYMSTNPAHPYNRLSPDTVLNAVESTGLLTDARILALNSYENRVYQVGIEGESPVVVKFYRPGRWTKNQILEEHQFLQELEELEIPVVSPQTIQGTTLSEFEGFLFAVFPRRGGRTPEPENMDSLFAIGRYVGRMHACGAKRPFQYRPTMKILEEARESTQWLCEQGFIPNDLMPAYSSIVKDLLNRMAEALVPFSALEGLRLHGDCHAGNILCRDEQHFFVDFDDCKNGPAVQDLWLLLCGDRQMCSRQISELVEGYEEFHEFNPAELSLIETLRTLRIMNYAAWLGKRWTDPAFPHHFPWFNTGRYWSEHILELREQQSALQEPPLKLIR